VAYQRFAKRHVAVTQKTYALSALNSRPCALADVFILRLFTMANTELPTAPSDSTAGAISTGHEQHAFSDSGIGSLNASDLNRLNTTVALEDNFQITDDDGTTGTTATTDSGIKDSFGEREKFDEKSDDSPRIGEFDEHTLDDGGKVVTFNPSDKGGVPAPLVFDKDGKNIIPIGAGGSGSQSGQQSSMWEYLNGAEVRYNHGDSHMTYTDKDGKSQQIKLKGPMNF